MRHIAFIITALVAASAFASDSVPAHIAKERDLDAYESGGVYRTPNNVDQLTDIEHLRQFVWSHWKRKRRGYVEFDFLGTDAATENWLFIEPASDRWRISWVEQGYRAPGLSPLPQVHREIVTVERCRGALIFFDSKDRVVTYL
jgi:hypothetical protein